jgi:hypothetical protein
MKSTTLVVTLLVLLLGPSTYAQRRTRRPDTFRRFVTALPAVDKIEVLTVTPFLDEDAKSLDCTNKMLRCKPDSFPVEITSSESLTGARADKLSTMWRKLERDYLHEIDKCFNPDHVLRFFQGDLLLLESEVCVYCRKITLPKVGMVHVAGSNDAPYFLFQDFLIPEFSWDQRIENFKRKMTPKIGQRFTVIGLLGGGKPALKVIFGDDGIYLHRMNVAQSNELPNSGC